MGFFFFIGSFTAIFLLKECISSKNGKEYKVSPDLCMKKNSYNGKNEEVMCVLFICGNQ